MAHIVEFAIGGLAGREKPLTIRMDRYINIFFGLNGSGKTSLLKILHSAMTGDASGLQLVPFSWAKVTIFSIDYDQAFTLELQKPSQQPSTDLFGEVPNAEKVQRTVRRRAVPLRWNYVDHPEMTEKPVYWHHTFMPTTRLYVHASPQYEEEDDSDTFSDIRKMHRDPEERFAGSLTEVWNAYTAEIAKVVQKAQAEGLANILRDVLDSSSKRRKIDKGASDPKVAYRRVERFLKRQGSSKILTSSSEFIAKYKDDTRLQRVVNDINTVEEKIERATAPRDELQELVSKLITGPKTIRFDEAGIKVVGNEKRQIDLALLSSGEKHLLLICVEALWARQSSILVDEPEISMHVDWQNVLVDSLRKLNPEAQLVVATHSPEVMARVKDANIFRL